MHSFIHPRPTYGGGGLEVKNIDKMNQDEMFDYMRAQMRKGTDELTALHNTLNKAAGPGQSEPFTPGEKHLYVRATALQPSAIRIIDFLATANNLIYRFEAIAVEVEFGGKKEMIGKPLIHIYKP